MGKLPQAMGKLPQAMVPARTRHAGKTYLRVSDQLPVQYQNLYINRKIIIHSIIVHKIPKTIKNNP